MSHHAHNVRHRMRREFARGHHLASVPVVLPDNIPPALGSPSPVVIGDASHVLVARATSTCGPNDNTGTCQKPTEISSVPIVLGAVIPITVAAVLMIILHRRHKKKLVLEDLNDKHKSLDFGLEVRRSAAKKGGPGASIDPEKPARKGRGMSMDLNSPYLLPAGLQQSRESFHSLSRNVHDGSDPYRPVTSYSQNDPYTRVKGDHSSVYTKSSMQTDRSNTHLLRDTYSHSNMSFPSRSEPNSPEDATPGPIRFPERSIVPGQNTQAPLRSPSSPLNQPALQHAELEAPDRNAENAPPSGAVEMDIPKQEMPASTPASALPTITTLPRVTLDEAVKSPSLPPAEQQPQAPSRAPRLQSMAATVHNANTISIISDTSDYGDGIKVTPPSPPREVQPRSHRHSIDAPMIVAQEQPNNRTSVNLGVQTPGAENRRLSMSIRPLPIEDPTDNPEQRAIRIRSFYKEYFDDSKPDPVGHYGYGDYLEDYGAERLSSAVYDPNSKDFIYTGKQAPFAEPVTRRAMTPPPRAPPRFRPGPGGPPSSRMSNNSNGTGRFMMPPRGQSAMSARSAPRKPLPPPAPLTTLPTPHMLKEDAMVFNPLDFAPPTTFRDRQAGRRPESPLGAPRPYSPSVPAHVPLESPFEELAALPSPFQLRKSGTFTALDFAPPPRFKTADAGSDAASIRSAGSGMSAVQLHSLRSGAYRVSRIPKEVVGTRDDIVDALRPRLDMVHPS